MLEFVSNPLPILLSPLQISDQTNSRVFFDSGIGSTKIMFEVEAPKAKTQKLNDDSFPSSSFGHDVHVGQASKLRREAVELAKRFNTTSACLNKKLHLVLDLDHTLVHTVSVPRLSEAEKYLLEEADSKTRDDLWTLTCEGVPKAFLTKLRPFLRNFLKEASELFTMSLYTMGNRLYVEPMLDIIDPERIYFGNRVITKDDSPYVMKTLALVMAEERAVLIVDDTPSVWTNHHTNLLEISKYKYFRLCGELESKTHSEEKTDDNESYGGLVDILKLLKEVHSEFFKVEEELDYTDMRSVLQDIEYNRMAEASLESFCKTFI